MVLAGQIVAAAGAACAPVALVVVDSAVVVLAAVVSAANVSLCDAERNDRMADLEECVWRSVIGIEEI